MSRDFFGDFIRKKELERAKRACEAGIDVGDWVNLIRHHRDVWCKVNDTFVLEGVLDSSDRIPLISAWSKDKKSQSFYVHEVMKIHKKNDPWDYKEVEFAYDERGNYAFRTHNNYTSLSEELMYHGTFKILPKFWYYKNRPVKPIKPTPLQKILSICGVVSLKKIPWKDCEKLIVDLKKIVVDGWSCSFHPEPEQIFNKTIMVNVPLSI